MTSHAQVPAVHFAINLAAPGVASSPPAVPTPGALRVLPLLKRDIVLNLNRELVCSCTCPLCTNDFPKQEMLARPPSQLHSTIRESLSRTLRDRDEEPVRGRRDERV